MSDETENKEKPKKGPKKIKVKAATAIGEDGVIYAKGDVFEVTEERAEALGDHVAKV